MRDDLYRVLAERSLRAPQTASQARLKVRAMSQLCESGRPVPIDRFRQDALALIANPFDDWLGSRVASMAEKVLAMLDGQVYDVPSETPEAGVTPGYWHPEPEDSPWRNLDCRDSQGLRDRWRERLQGSPEGWLAEDEH